jgi:hypothetical protein
VTGERLGCRKSRKSRADDDRLSRQHAIDHCAARRAINRCVLTG